MVNHTKGLYHFHRRKRVHRTEGTYPPNKWKHIFDKAIYVIGAVGPVMTIPQLTKIWVEKNASGVSAVSWGAYLVTAIFWLLYGILHKEKPIIFTYSAWIVLEILIVIGTITYG